MSKRLFLLRVAFLIVLSLVAESTVVQLQSGTIFVQASIADQPSEAVRPIANLTADNIKAKGHLEIKVEGTIVNPNSFHVYDVSIGLRFGLLMWRGPTPIEWYNQTRTINIGTIASNKEVPVSENFSFTPYADCGLQLFDFVYYVRWDDPSDSSPEQITEPPPKPSVPEFTVTLVACPYDVPSTSITNIDEYTGKETVRTLSGYRVENKSIEITIKNQPFTPYTDVYGHEINLYYKVRSKGHFGDNWAVISCVKASSSAYPVPPNSEYTSLSLSAADYPDGAQVDFQVAAIIGYYKFSPVSADELNDNSEYVDESGWSNTQTITIKEEVPIVPLVTILLLILAMIVVIVIYKKKTTKHQAY